MSPRGGRPTPDSCPRLSSTHALSVEQRADRWREILGAVTARSFTLVASATDDLVGFAACSPVRVDDPTDLGVEEATGEVQAIYVHPDHWGTGAGRALLGSARDRLGACGFGDAVIWVLEGNDRARRFYEADGWRPDGAAKTAMVGGAELDEIRYRRPSPDPTRSLIPRVP